MSYLYIEAYRGQFSSSVMCHVMQVATSGYYDWRTQENGKLLVEIKAVHAESDLMFGGPRICRTLKQQGIRCSENRVARLMYAHGVCAKQTKRFKATTDSRHRPPVAGNVLDRQFEPVAPNEAWAADITYVWTREGWLYLAAVTDLFSRRIVSLSMQRVMGRQFVINALRMALGRRPRTGLLHHSTHLGGVGPR